MIDAISFDTHKAIQNGFGARVWFLTRLQVGITTLMRTKKAVLANTIVCDILDALQNAFWGPCVIFGVLQDVNLESDIK